MQLPEARSIISTPTWPGSSTGSPIRSSRRPTAPGHHPARHPDPRRAAGPPPGRRIRAFEGVEVPVGALDVTLYRDDLRLRGARAIGPTDLPPAGWTAPGDPRRRRALLRPHDPGRPGRAGRPRPARAVQLAGLVDRGHRELPIRADYVGKNIPTALDESVRVLLPRRTGRRGRITRRGGAMKIRHLLSAADLDRADATAVLDTATEMAAMAGREVKKLPTLRGRTVVNLFYEDSTRTRISFEAAAKRLSADVINFSAKGSSVSKGESLKDTALTLQAMGADAVVIRHPASGAPHRLANWVDGTCSTPATALTSTRRRPCWTPTRCARATAGSRASRCHRGGRAAQPGGPLQRAPAAHPGAHVTLVAPPTLLPVGVTDWAADVSYDLDAALPNADVVMMLRVQRERMNDSFFPSEREYSRRYGLDADRVRGPARARDRDASGPMNRGMEIAPEVADSARSTIVEQVANGVSVRMAVLYLMLGGPR
jgi:aspartate carbamoyltransferase catalytic subunit